MEPPTLSKSEKNIDEMFGGLNIFDPSIKVTPDTLKLSPFYFNFLFLLNFFLLGVSIYLIIIQTDLKLDLLCSFVILMSIYLIIDQLLSCNTIIIKIKTKSIIIQPNVFIGFIIRKKVFDFSQIKNIYASEASFRPAFNRHTINLTLRNGNKIKLISTNEKEIAVELSKKLLSLFH
jgi:hypothetical protein